MTDTGASQIAATLRARGVTTIFALCGDHTNPLAEAFDDAGIRIVDTRDERGAGWMAAGWALATGEPGVVLVSNTPALTNALTPLADAHASGMPVVCITGGVAMGDRGRGHPGDADQAAIARAVVGWSERIEHADAAARMTDAAWGAATGRKGDEHRARPGAAVLEVPMDVQQARATSPEPSLVTLESLVPDRRAIAAARAALGDAKTPVILAGSGCFWSGARDALHRLVEGARIPVFTSRAARGLISDDHELCMGFPNLLTPAAQMAYGEADVALIVGSKLDVMLAGGAFHPGCRVVRVDVDPTTFTLGREAEIPIRGDARAVLEALADGASPLPTDAWVARLREAVDARADEIAARARIGSAPVHPGRLVADLAAALPDDAVVCVDAGALGLWAIDALPARTPSSLHTSSGSALGALGMGVPWAIGMKIARPDRPVVALVGDGSFGFTALELETAVRHGAPVATVVGNDGGWGIVRHLQERIHGRALASDLPVSPYEVLAEFAGGVGDVVETPQQLAVALTNAVVASTPSIVNVHLDATARHEAIGLIAAMFEAKRDATR